MLKKKKGGKSLRLVVAWWEVKTHVRWCYLPSLVGAIAKVGSLATKAL
jgi:hypothetical protein